MGTLISDVRYGMRMLLKTPVLAAVAALSLGFGIAGATAMFALASSFFLQPLTFGDQDGLVVFQQVPRGQSVDNAAGISGPNVTDLSAASGTTRAIAAFTPENVNLTGLDQPEQIQVATGTSNLFDVLQIPLAQGRGFRPEEGEAGRRDVLVITHAFWQQRFLADPSVLGRVVSLNGRAHTVVGVTGSAFEMVPAGVQAFRPSDLSEMENRALRDLIAFGRLADGVTPEQAHADLAGAFARLADEFPEANRNQELLVTSVRRWFPGPSDTRLVFMLLTVSLFGFVIACANVANLLLGRAEMRVKEVAVRLTLGARRPRVLRQLLTESLLLALGGGGLGILLSVFVIRGLRTAMPAEVPRAFLPVLDWPTLGATVLVVTLGGLLFGLAPALHATGGSLADTLAQGTRGGTAGRQRKRIRSAFVVTEVAVALAMLTGAGFIIKAMDTLVRRDNGFEERGLVTFTLTLPEHRYAGEAAFADFVSNAERELAAVPGVEGVGVMASLPRGRNNPRGTFHVLGTPEVDASDRPDTGWQPVTPGYLETLGVPLVAGRFLADADRADAVPVAVVNQEFVRRYVPEGEVVGRRIEIFGREREIVGVTQNVVQERIGEGLGDETAVYLPFAQQPRRNPAFVLRTRGDVAALVPALRDAIARVDPEQPVAQMRTMEEHIAVALSGPIVVGVFTLALGVLAMVLAAIGIYGVMSHDVTQSTREIGIRMAVGARGAQVVRLITGRGLALTGLGVAMGAPLAWLVHRLVSASFGLFEVRLAPDYELAAAAMLVGVAALASWLPARRAARVEPVEALQTE